MDKLEDDYRAGRIGREEYQDRKKTGRTRILDILSSRG